MNRKEIREQVFARLDWSPDSTPVAVSRLNSFIERANQILGLDAPFAFFETRIRVATQPDVSPASDTDLVQMFAADDVPDGGVVYRNPWVFRTSLPVGDGAEWLIDRSWEGRYIDITDDDEVVHTNQIRSVWEQEFNGDTYYFFTLLRPWPWSEYGNGPFRWRVYTPTYFLPDNVVEIKSARILNNGNMQPIKVLGEAEAERLGLDTDYNNNISAVSTAWYPVMFRREHVQIPAPNVAPEEEENTYDPVEFPAFAWTGPEPVGTFEVCYTYAWGKRDIDYQSPGVPLWSTEGATYEESSGENETAYTEWAKNRAREPLFESAPSPVVEFEVEANVESNERPKAALLRLPNIQYMLGMLLAGEADSTDFRRFNSDHSGWSVRLYIRRKTADFTNYDQMGGYANGMSVSRLRKLDIRDDFFLLYEMRIDEHNGGLAVINGSVIPDYLRPLRDVHGFQGFRLMPPNTARQEIEFRVIQRPNRMLSDSDVSQVHAEANEALIAKTLELTYEHLMDRSGVMKAKADYLQALAVIKKRYGDMRPDNQPIYRRSANMWNGTYGWRNWRPVS